MKRLIFLLFLSVIFFSFVSAEITSVSCNEPGFDYCAEAINNDWLPAQAHAKVYYNLQDEGNSDGINQGFAVGSLFTNIRYLGDKLYFIERLQNWNNVQCNDNGCSFSSGNSFQIGTGGNTQGVFWELAGLGEEYNGCPSFLAWDFDTNSGWQSTVYIGSGWIGSNNCLNWKVVQCYDNSDCSGNQICDKSGNWQNWQCAQAVCQEGQTQCSGDNYQTCQNNNWVNQGQTAGQCGIQCLSNSDCPNQYACSNNQCLPQQICPNGQTRCVAGGNNEICQNNHWVNRGQIPGMCGVPPSTSTYYRLSENQCLEIELSPSEVTDLDFSTRELCEENIEEESNLTTYLAIGVVAFLLIFASIKFNLFGKKRKKRK